MRIDPQDCPNRGSHTTGSSHHPYVMGTGERTELLIDKKGVRRIYRRCLTCRLYNEIPHAVVWEWIDQLPEVPDVVRFNDIEKAPS